MIEAEGVKIATDPEEAFWTDFKDKCQKQILNNKREILINEELILLSDKKLSEVNKNGK